MSQAQKSIKDSGNMNVYNNLTVIGTGTTTLGGALAVTGAVTLSDSLTVTGAVTTAASPVTTTNVGTAATGVTATENGDGVNHVTTLTVGATFGTIAVAGAAAEGVGELLYTFPAGKIVIHGASADFNLTATGTVDADTPEMGLGTVVASGAVSVLGGTATFENVMVGTAIADVDGTQVDRVSASQAASLTGAALYFNLADTWAGADTITVTSGSLIKITWSFLGA